MRKLQNNSSIKIWTVKLYLEDLQEIINILKEWGYSNIKIRTENYEYSESELASIKINDGYLYIFSNIPNYITIHFNARSSYAWVDINIPEWEDLKNDWIKYRIENLLRSKKRNLLNSITSLGFFLVTSLVSNLIALYYSTTWMEYFMILFSIYIPLWSFYILPIRSNKIYIKNEVTATFFEQYGGYIIGGIISVIVWWILKLLGWV